MEGSFIFLVMAKTGLPKQSASNFVAGCIFLFYINIIRTNLMRSEFVSKS